MITGSEDATHDLSPPIKVYLLMDSRISREALTRTLRRFPDVALGGEWRADGEGPPTIDTSLCHVLVMDTWNPERLSGSLGTDASALPELKTLLIGMDNNRDQFLAAVRAGVTGYLLKDASVSEIVVAIRALARGEAHCPPELSLCLFQQVAQQRGGSPARSMFTIPTLTLRQQKLAQLVAQGLTNKEIAAHLRVSEFTVRNHVHRIIRRLRVTNRREVGEAVHALQRQLW